MKEWTEQEIVDKLDQGWVLNGDMGKETPFGFIDREPSGFNSYPTIPASIVRKLSEKGVLEPSPLPGRTISYRRASS